MFVFLSYWKNFVGTEKRVRISHGKRAYCVRAIEVILYFKYSGICTQANSVDQDQTAPKGAKTCLQTYADYVDPDQPAHLCSLTGPTPSASRIIGYYRMYEWREKAWMILCACTGWFISIHFAHVRRHFIAWCGLFIMPCHCMDPSHSYKRNVLYLFIFIKHC